MSAYLVLREVTRDDDRAPLWEVVTVDEPVEASTPQQAIRAATAGMTAEERGGRFVATPTRSWKPITRRVDTVEREVWE